jgi:hypothetical protein
MEEKLRKQKGKKQGQVCHVFKINGAMNTVILQEHHLDQADINTKEALVETCGHIFEFHVTRMIMLNECFVCV